MQYAAMDTIMQMVFSSPPGFLQQGKDVNNLIGGIHALLNAGQVISQYPQIMKVLHLPLINPLLAPQPTDKTGPGVIAGVCEVSLRFVSSTDIRSLHTSRSGRGSATATRARNAMFCRHSLTIATERARTFIQKCWKMKLSGLCKCSRNKDNYLY